VGCFIFWPVKPLLFFYQTNISIVQEDRKEEKVKLTACGYERFYQKGVSTKIPDTSCV
jgi:hypothetical protein